MEQCLNGYEGIALPGDTEDTEDTEDSHHQTTRDSHTTDGALSHLV